jgi:transcriptional regulator with XRE-family HTH domain
VKKQIGKYLSKERIMLSQKVSQRPTINKARREVSSRFAVAIRTAREQKKLSLQELGKLTDTSGSYINRLETYQRKNPTLTVLFSLAEALQINVWQLLKIALNEEQNSPDVVQLLLNEPFSINGVSVNNPTLRKLLMDIVSYIVYNLNENVSHRDIPPLFDLIEKFHHEKKVI